MKEKAKKFAKWLWQEWIKPLIIVVAILAPVRSAIADWNDVPTGSMKPTILEGDRVFVNKLAYDLKIPFTTVHIATWDDPKRGDIVVLFSPADGKRLVKRVVGLPGDRIQMKNNILYINGRRVGYQPINPTVIEDMPSADRADSVFATEDLDGVEHAVMSTPEAPALRSFGPVNVPAGHYFVMGDNRDNSFDSRFFGFVARDEIVGRAVGVAFSVDHAHYYKPRMDRFFHALH